MKKQITRILAALCLTILCTVQTGAVPKTLIPGGSTVGIKLYTQGLVVTGFDSKSPAKAAGIKKGDIIMEVDGEPVHTAAALRDSLTDKQVVLTVMRSGKEAEFCVTPEKINGNMRLGTYLRDSMAGIGTVTYYDPNTGGFGALGHGVSDADAAILIPVEAGVVVKSSVKQVEKGKHGHPGELVGEFDVESILGDVEQNTEHGIFGTLNIPVPGSPMPVAEPEDVKIGPAAILTNVRGQDICAYSVQIERIYPNAHDSGRNMLISITDKRLLDITGGIVQGMSGSPIIQNGKLVGAVTHVLVNDPQTGYGIFIENMLDAAG